MEREHAHKPVWRLDAIAIATPVAKGSFVLSSSDPASAVYVVRSGKIALIWANSNEVYPMDSFGPLNILGLPAAFNGEYSDCAGCCGFGVGVHSCKQSDGNARTQSESYARDNEAVGARSSQNEGDHCEPP